MGNQTQAGQDDLNLSELTLEELTEKYQELADEKSKVETAKNESYKEAQTLNWVVKVSRDANEFVKLYNSDRKMAERVVAYNNKQYDETFTVDDYLSQIGAKKDSNPEDEVVSKVKESLKAEEAAKIYDDFLTKKEIDEESDFGKDVIDIFDELMEGKKITPENTEKYLKIALREAKRTSEFTDSYKKAVDEVQGISSPKGGSSEPQRKVFTQQKAAIFDYVKKK